MDYVSYIDSYRYKDKRYFSCTEFNGLFCECIKDGNVEYLGCFPQAELFGRLLHKKVIGIEDTMYFFPLTGSGMSIYDINENTFEFWNLGIENEPFSVSNAFLIQTKIVIIPMNIESGLYLFDTVAKKMQRVPCFESLYKDAAKEIVLDLFSADVYKNCLYIASKNTNHIFEVKLTNYEVQKYEIRNVNKLRNIAFCGNELWATDCEDLVAYKISVSDCFAEKILFKRTNEQEEIPLQIVSWNNKTVALPGFGSELYEYDSSQNAFVSMNIQIPTDWVGDVIGYALEDEIVLYAQTAVGFFCTMRDGCVRISKDGKVDRLFTMFSGLREIKNNLIMQDAFIKNKPVHEENVKGISLEVFLEFISNLQ